MEDKNKNKVINLFNSLHNNDDEKCKGDICFSKDGIPYVTVEHDKNGNLFDVNHLLQNAALCKYVVRVLKDKQKPILFNYLVTGDKLLEFIANYIQDERNGKIIEIERYYSTGPA
jgi:hypothetical protein